jgi:hypothetical protein
MAESAQPPDLEPGEFYEDCRYHPMVCVSLGTDGDELEGISLVTGDIGSCSLNHCGVVKLTAAEAIQRRLHWDEFVEKHGLTDYSSSHYRRDDPPRFVG